MKRKGFIELLLVIVLAIFMLSGCAQVGPQVIKTDVEFHKNVLDVATTRIQYVSCDIGLIDGLGIASSVSFPIKNGDEARAILQNPGISLALGEMKAIATEQNMWKPEDYAKCKVLGLGYRATALGTIDILKMFPQLTSYLSIFGM